MAKKRAEDNDLIVETAKKLHVTPHHVFENAYRLGGTAAQADFFHHEWLIYGTLETPVVTYCQIILTEGGAAADAA